MEIKVMDMEINDMDMEIKDMEVTDMDMEVKEKGIGDITMNIEFRENGITVHLTNRIDKKCRSLFVFNKRICFWLPRV